MSHPVNTSSTVPTISPSTVATLKRVIAPASTTGEEMMEAMAGVWETPVAATFGEWNRIRVTFDRLLSMEECWTASACIGYALREHLGGHGGPRLSEPMIQLKRRGHGPSAEPVTVLFFSYESSDCRRRNIAQAFIDAATYLIMGTPIRQSDRAGAGTAGTPKTIGVGLVTAQFHVRAYNPGT